MCQKKCQSAYTTADDAAGQKTNNRQKLMSESKTKHSPGPWRIASAKDNHAVFQADSCICVADCNSGTVAPTVQPANARLISAAPDLLAALERLARAVRGHRHTLSTANLIELVEAEDAATAVIAKAKGAA